MAEPCGEYPVRAPSLSAFSPDLRVDGSYARPAERAGKKFEKGKMRMKAKKFSAIMLCLALLCSLCMPTAFAAGYNDTAGHWAESAIDRWSGYNIVEGFGGNFSPDDSLTRGQMAKILSNTLGLTETAANPFSDVPSDAWYTPFVLRCYAAGIMQGDGAMANPEAVVTRQETMVMICRALDIAPVDSAGLSSYADAGDVADWAAPYVAALTGAGIVNGVGGSQLAPGGSMTRASIMAVLDRAVVQYINAPGSYTLTNKAGLILVAVGDVTLTGTTSGNILVTPAASGKAVDFEKANVTGSVTVKADNAKITTKDSTLPDIVQNGAGITVEKKDTPASTGTIRPSTGSGGGGGGSSSGGGGGGTPAPTPTPTPSTPGSTTGDLQINEADPTLEAGVTTYKNIYINAGVGDGEVALSNITIEENLYIRGGGSGSIKLNNVTIGGRIIMDKTLTDTVTQPPRLELTNTPVTRPIEVKKAAIVEAKDTASAVTYIGAAAKVEIRGGDTTVGTVEVLAGAEDPIEVEVTSGTVNTVAANSEAKIAGAGGTVKDVTAKAGVEIDRANGVKTVTVPAAASETVAVDVKNGTVDKVVAEKPATVTSSGSGTGKVKEVEAKASVTVDSEVVDKVEIPEIVEEKIEIEVTGDGELDVVVNTTAEVDISTTDDADVGVSSDTLEEDELDVELNGEKIEHIHQWTDWTDDEDGEHHSRTCENTNTPCDKSNKETAEHTYGEPVGTAATCTEDGKQTSTCSVCGYKKEETVTKLGHDFSGDTYGHDDADHWKVCARCGAADEAKTAHAHSANYDCTVGDTCVCGYEWVAVNGHNLTWNKTADKHSAECANCTYTVAEADHVWGDATDVAADDANHKITCTVCGQEKTAAHTYPAGWEDTGDGEHHKMTCSDCGHEKTEAHDFVDNEDATALHNAGGHWYVCAACNGESQPEEHKWGDYQFDLGDASAGHWKECSICDEVGEKGNHEFDISSDSCESATEVECTTCDYTETRSSTGHEYAASMKDAEQHEWRCVYCKTIAASADDLESGHEPTEAHDWSDSDPDDENWEESTSDGGATHTHTCVDCGYTETAPHNWGDPEWVPDDATDTHTRTCVDCGKVETEDHKIISWEMDEPDDDDSESATHSGKCTLCGKTVTKAHDLDAANAKVTEADCANPKTTSTPCKDCDYVQVTTEDEATGEHSVAEWTADAPADDGSVSKTHSGTCTVCGKTVTNDHYVKTWTASDPPEGGDVSKEHSGTCADCNEKLTAEHDYEWQDNGDGTHTGACEQCEAGLTQPHYYGEKGAEEDACILCKHVKTEEDKLRAAIAEGEDYALEDNCTISYALDIEGDVGIVLGDFTLTVNAPITITGALTIESGDEDITGSIEVGDEGSIEVVGTTSALYLISVDASGIKEIICTDGEWSIEGAGSSIGTDPTGHINPEFELDADKTDADSKLWVIKAVD